MGGQVDAPVWQEVSSGPHKATPGTLPNRIAGSLLKVVSEVSAHLPGAVLKGRSCCMPGMITCHSFIQLYLAQLPQRAQCTSV